MADASKVLRSKYKPTSRYANFGPVINSIQVIGFRGICAQMNLEYPVTAITGLNGAGKSTVGQLLLCAYRPISTAEYKRFYVKDFFPVSVADPSPFTADASVTYKYETSKPQEDQSLTVTRAVKEWSGYKRQPERASIYVGLAFYLPKVERRDLTIYSAKSIELSDRADVEDGAVWASRILGNTYDEVFFQGVKAKDREGELGMASRHGAQYSENNMGFGEGRVIHTIRLLESCPVQSLVVLEEPETSLHEFAQYEFAKYLMDVSERRGHQIFFSTHSSAMIRAIPPEGRKMLSRASGGVQVHDRLSSIHIRNALTEGYDGHLVVAVEDVFAQSLLRELIRQHDKDLLKRIKVKPFGDAVAVKQAVKVLKEGSVNVVGVRDGDQNPIPSENLYCLPGSLPPEKIVFLSDSAKELLIEQYAFDIEHALAAYPDLDHHDYAKHASEHTGYSREVIEHDVVRAFLDAQGSDYGEDLVETLRSAA